jgi:cobalt-zinc-cadmium efflux system membrane fusion protein
MSVPFVRYLNASTALLATAALIVVTTGCGEQEQGHAPEGESHAGEPSATAIMAAHKHDHPDETCFICDPSKRDKGRLWCGEHVRYEDRCWYCHPELEDKGRVYCKEHFLYDDECFLCHPELKGDSDIGTGESPHEGHNHHGHDHGGHGASADQATGSQAHGDGLFCNEHGVYEIECAVCQPDRVAALNPGEHLKVRLPSTASADKAGIRTSRPQPGKSTPAIDALCEVQYNLNTMARVTPLADGVIRSVARDGVDQVTTGEVLLELHSAKVATSKSNYLSALVERDIRKQAFEREKRLREQNIAAEKDYLEAQAALRSAKLAVNNLQQHLVNLGFTEDEITAIERDQDTSSRLTVRAPFDGTIVERNAVMGEAVSVGQSVFTVADLSSRWLTLSIPSRHITQVRTGQQVLARFDELPGVDVRGQVTWIDTSIDQRSRMVKARALVTDDADQLKTGLFGKARVVVGDSRPATIVPRDAVQRHEGGFFVFVQDEADLFSIRRVALGQANGQTIEVLAGLNADEPVVTEGSFVVMSEFLKSRLGAGCADH